MVIDANLLSDLTDAERAFLARSALTVHQGACACCVVCGADYTSVPISVGQPDLGCGTCYFAWWAAHRATPWVVWCTVRGLQRAQSGATHGPA